MTDSSRRGAANLAPVLMILAFAAMLGFLWWLGATSEGTTVPTVQEDTAADTVGSTAREVTPADLMSPQNLEGQDVRITAGVASSVGSQAFFLDLPQSPFLVREPSGQPLPQGEVEVVGVVRAMNDSTIQAWTDAGAISAGDRPVVEFATHYIDARRVRPAGGAARGGQGGASGQESGGGS